MVCFENFQGVLYSHRQSTNEMMNTFIVVNITPTSKRLLLICFESFQVIPFSYTGRVDRGW